MNLFFAQHAFHPVIPRGSEDEVAESTRQNLRIDMDFASSCRMTSTGGYRMKDETKKNHLKTASDFLHKLDSFV